MDFLRALKSAFDGNCDANKILWIFFCTYAKHFDFILMDERILSAGLVD